MLSDALQIGALLPEQYSEHVDIIALQSPVKQVSLVVSNAVQQNAGSFSQTGL